MRLALHQKTLKSRKIPAPLVGIAFSIRANSNGFEHTRNLLSCCHIAIFVENVQYNAGFCGLVNEQEHSIKYRDICFALVGSLESLTLTLRLLIWVRNPYTAGSPTTIKIWNCSRRYRKNTTLHGISRCFR